MIAAIYASRKVQEALAELKKEGIDAGKKALIHRLTPTARQKAAKEAIRLFAEEWNEELEATSRFGATLEPLRDQLRSLIETAAAEIAIWMDPEIKEVDLGLLASTWVELKLDSLPGDFKWTRVGENYARAIKRYIRNDEKLGAAYGIALQERQTEATVRMAGLDPGFDLEGYRKFLIEKKCDALQLAIMHSNTYDIDRKVTLWSIFVPQSARESTPIVEIPPEILRKMRKEGHLSGSEEQEGAGKQKEALDEARKRYESSAVRPVLEIVERNRLVAVVGDPGSGKTSLLKYLALQWAKDNVGPLPLLVDLKEYVKTRKGLIEYFQSGPEVFRLDAGKLEERLRAGDAALYLDGLDEIFDIGMRQAVIEEIVALSSRYAQARMVVSTRKVGYEPERLRSAGFLHATLEEFDDVQMRDFLRQWHRVAEADDKERAKMLERLERALEESQPIRELAGNPLLLTMMAILNRNQELPRSRVALYREASRVLLDEWDARRALPVGEFDREDKEELLREIAGEMQQAEGGLAGNLIEQPRLRKQITSFLDARRISDSHLKSRKLLQQLTERNFVLAFAGAGRFCFVHRTFLEYFCADWFRDRFQRKQDLTLEELKTEVFGRHWKDEKWHEVLRLIAGMIDEKKAEELILFLMEQDGRNDELANLMLAAGCLHEVRNRGAVQATSQALWKRFVDEAIRFEPPVGREEKEDTYYSRRATRQASVGWMALVWKGENALIWLRPAATQDHDWTVREAAVEELARGWRDDPGTLSLLKERAHNDKFYAVRWAAVWELARGWKDDPGTLPLLRDRAQNDENYEVRRAAVEEIARGWKDDPGTLPLLRDRAQNDGS